MESLIKILWDIIYPPPPPQTVKLVVGRMKDFPFRAIHSSMRKSIAADLCFIKLNFYRKFCSEKIFLIFIELIKEHHGNTKILFIIKDSNDNCLKQRLTKCAPRSPWGSSINVGAPQRLKKINKT